MRLKYMAALVALTLGLGCSSSSLFNSDGDLLGEVDPECMADADCPDDNPCKPGVCIDGLCSVADRTGVCDDQDPCTEGDSCLQGYCVGMEKGCDNTLWCDGHETCDPKTGLCLAGVVPVQDDGVACTAESCDEVNDTLLRTPDHTGCFDKNPCTQDYCDLAAGCLSILVEGTACDDADPCTVSDACNSKGVCAGETKECGDGVFCNGSVACNPETGQCLPVETPLVFSDSVECTVDTCDEEARSLVHTPNDDLCDDDNQCTTDLCSIEVGGCLHVQEPLDCDDGSPCTSDDICVAGECVGTMKSCDDGLFCNGLETCNSVSGKCEPGTPPVLDDSVACTAGTCNEETDAVDQTPQDLACDDQDQCTADVCDLTLGGCQYSAYNCTAPACFYHHLCGVLPGESCAEPTRLNYAMPLEVGETFEHSFEVLQGQSLYTPACLATGADGLERWFSFSLAESANVALSVEADVSQIAVVLFQAPCQGDAMLCSFGVGPTFLAQLVLAAGEYSVVVDLVDPTEPFSLIVTAEAIP